MVMVRLAPLPPRVMLALGTTAGLVDVAVTTRLDAGTCASPTVNDNGPKIFGRVNVCGKIGLIVGELLTVSKKLVVVVRLAALVTLMVMVAVPTAVGNTVMVRLAPLPPRVMLASGTTDWVSEEAVTVSWAAGVTASPTVKGRAEVPFGRMTV